MASADSIDLCLVVPPFAQVKMPTLGTAILARACRARGLKVRTVHANILLAARAGHAVYSDLAQSSRREMAGERMFRAYAWPAAALAAMEAPHPLTPGVQALFDAVAPHAAAALDDACARILALKPRIVGISSVFQQNLAASAIALRIKRAAPDICIVLGGPNVAQPMGGALAEIMPWVDHFFIGEADVAFAAFCERLVREGERPAERVIDCPPLLDMRQSPAPDFSDYFDDLRAAQASGQLPAALPEMLAIETSRGCWWGAKRHCTFCGLNGETMMFRAKPPEDALAEFEALEAEWEVGRYMAADNIMPQQYLTRLVPALAERETTLDIFYEVKANLSPEQLALMHRAGIQRIQPGIESLSSRMLKLMRKGVSAHQNIALLRSARALGTVVVWNHLYHFPGETEADYAPLLDLIPAIAHLQPPEGLSPIVIDRYSPYFEEADRFGIGALTPLRGYRGLYPAEARIGDIAYHFRGSYTTGLGASATLLRLRTAIAQWRLIWAMGRAPVLEEAGHTADGVWIRDTRRIARAPRTLISHRAVEVLHRLERAHSLEGMEPALLAEAEALVEAGFVIVHEGKLLSLVTRPIAMPGEAVGGDAFEELVPAE